MNSSTNLYEIVRHLYYYRNHAKNLLKSRTYTVGKTLKIAVKQPVIFGKKAIVMLATNPRRLYYITTGKLAIQNNKKIQQELMSEYQQWIEATKLTAKEKDNQRKQSRIFKKSPLVSLITPVFNPPVDAHKKLINSVLEQTYDNFELLLYNFGEGKAVEELLNEYASKDSRIKVRHGLPNNGIGANSNVCLEDVSGEFVALLDHDDALTVDALFECIKALNKTDTDFIYTDKDKITEGDERFDPLFKPDWSPEMALGGNYMTHLNLMRTELVKDLGGWDPETDGAQDWDLFLRIITKSTKPIVHVPKIVYHWRTVKTSTAAGNNAKPYVAEAQRRAVEKHLRAIGINNAEPVHDLNGQMTIRWSKDVRPTFVLQILYNDIGNVRQTIKSLGRDGVDYRNCFIFTPKDLTSPSELDELNAISGADTIVYEPGDFIGSLQKSVKENDFSETVIYLNDAIIEPENMSSNSTSWVAQLCGWLEIKGVSVAGCGLYSDNGQISDIGSFFDPGSLQFSKFYLGAGLKSNYNGHSEWIRNHVLVSEKLFAFRVNLINKLPTKIRDDEIAKAVALVCFAHNERGVYDPLIRATDAASFELRYELSVPLEGYLRSNCASLLEADPFYSKNLNATYIDPKPRITGQKTTVKDNVFLRSVETP